MLRSLALIRHSVRSLSVGLHQQRQTHRGFISTLLYLSVHGSSGPADHHTFPLLSISFYMFDFVWNSSRYFISICNFCRLTCRQTWWGSQAARSPGLSWRSTRWCSSALRRCSSHSNPSRWGPFPRGSSCTCGTPHTPCGGSAEPTWDRGQSGSIYLQSTIFINLGEMWCSIIIFYQ